MTAYFMVRFFWHFFKNIFLNIFDLLVLNGSVVHSGQPLHSFPFFNIYVGLLSSSSVHSRQCSMLNFGHALHDGFAKIIHNIYMYIGQLEIESRWNGHSSSSQITNLNLHEIKHSFFMYISVGENIKKVGRYTNFLEKCD